jgi:hypothetical protein
VRVWKYFFNLTVWKHIREERKNIQKERKTKDWQIAQMISGRIWYQEVGDWKLKLANLFLGVYWFLVKSILRIFNV